jgi:uncharacterized protein YxjI
MPFCTHCGHEISSFDRFCKSCGSSTDARVSEGTSAIQDLPTQTSPLLTADQFVLVRNKLAFWIKFEFQDQSGMKLGETQGELKLPVSYTVLDTSGQPVMVLDGRIERMQPVYFVRARNSIIATLRMKSSFMSRKWGIWQNNESKEGMLFITDATSQNMKIQDEGGAVLATAYMNFGFKTEKIDVRIPETSEVDHRVVIGCVLLGAQ